MTSLVFNLFGGVGLFLIGMLLLTDGIKSYAGDALRRGLVRFTGTPLKAFASGTLVTLLVQSSSATTLTVIGFVSAGLIAFPQAVGVVFGASLGTTGTGWIVATLGLKVSIGFYALPLIGVGAFITLLARGRLRSLGMALAGFGIIFVGIETLQRAMQELSTIVNLAEIPSSGFLAHVLAMAIGVIMTVVMQSSTAAVATTLTALHSGAINFEQSASLVIGAAIGTTVTGAIAAIGGSVPAKRTALAHVLFNLATGLIAVILLPVFLGAIYWAQEHFELEPGTMSLAAFHTAFIAFGVVLFLPFVDQFAGYIERILPDRGSRLTQHLDDTVLEAPAVAYEATHRALRLTAAETMGAIGVMLMGNDSVSEESEQELREALAKLQEFFPRIPNANEGEALSQQRVGQLHAIDHLFRLQKSLVPSSGLRQALAMPSLQPAVTLTKQVLELAEQGLRDPSRESSLWVKDVEKLAQDLVELRKRERPIILERTAISAASPSQALELLDAMRWLDQMGYHAQRICHYLGRNGGAEESSPGETDHRYEDLPKGL